MQRLCRVLGDLCICGHVNPVVDAHITSGVRFYPYC